MGTKLRQPESAKQRAYRLALDRLIRLWELAHPKCDPSSVSPEDVIPWALGEIEKLRAIEATMQGRRG